MKIILMFVLLTVGIWGNDDCSLASPEVKSIFIRNDIDLEAKSTKGWLRIFNSNDKILEYGYYVNEHERYLVLTYLKSKLNHKKKRYTRGVNQ